MPESIFALAASVDWVEAAGLLFGIGCVWLLIRQNIWNWPLGIIYVFISVYIFWQARLYADLGLHLLAFLPLNLYGWYYWSFGNPDGDDDVPVTTTAPTVLLALALASCVGVLAMGWYLTHYTDASVPYWDSTTTVLSIAGIWLTTRKKLENWMVWLVVDVLATGIYFYKGLYFYCILYLIYVGMAGAGYVTWRRSMFRPAVLAT